mmetsp:Transcript_11611/g.24612  ORF Transcript_11611/g.24612 Transcript_11611/m.24612 type:complete len:443 (-) Transcript_11611:1331-2659(-)
MSGYIQAVSRSNEFLSCAKTSLKLRQQERFRHDQQQRDPSQGGPLPPPPSNVKILLSTLKGPPPASLVILEDGLTLLRGMEYGTKQLQVLVRRRGHTNDPTQEIGAIVKQLEQDFKELTSYCEQLSRIQRRKQEGRHWGLIVQWFQQVANHHSMQLQDCLKLRGEILAEQAQKRRKLVETGFGNKNKKSSSSNEIEIGTASAEVPPSGKATPLFDSPLFTAKPPKRYTNSTTRGGAANSHASQSHRRQDLQSNYRNTQPSTALSGSSSNYYREKTSQMNGTGAGTDAPAYGAAYSANHNSCYAGYGGGGYGNSGMRQRRGNNQSSSTIPFQEQEEEEKIHSQIQVRERKRQTQQRLDEARQAESTLSEVAKLYSKMSTLITQQGETLEKIEDDVECALVDVSAGQEELTKLYSIKKGNRPLIIKIYAILIFLIVFMRGYKDR